MSNQDSPLKFYNHGHSSQTQPTPVSLGVKTDISMCSQTSSDAINTDSEDLNCEKEPNPINLTFDGHLKDLRVPIVGYEVIEERAKFTIFKIQIEVKESEDTWCVYRRYTDFSRLNKKIQESYPAQQVHLPPKRWVRDNFDSGFLNKRLAGLQAFLSQVLLIPDIHLFKPLRDFLCLDDPSRENYQLYEDGILGQNLEEEVHNLRALLRTKEEENMLLHLEIDMLKSAMTAQTSAHDSQRNLSKNDQPSEEANNMHHLSSNLS